MVGRISLASCRRRSAGARFLSPTTAARCTWPWHAESRPWRCSVPPLQTWGFILTAAIPSLFRNSSAAVPVRPMAAEGVRWCMRIAFARFELKRCQRPWKNFSLAGPREITQRFLPNFSPLKFTSIARLTSEPGLFVVQPRLSRNPTGAKAKRAALMRQWGDLL